MVKSIVGDIAYGNDCDLYGACGYIRKSDQQSGLTHKSKAASKTATGK